MRITLISTSTFPSDQGIRTISSVLKKQGHDVKLAFMTLSENYSRNYTKDELIQLLKLCKNSKLIGVNAYASTSQRASRIISFLKKHLIPGWKKLPWVLLRRFQLCLIGPDLLQSAVQ